MEYLNMLRALYLMSYYELLSTRPCASYTLSVVIAVFVGFGYILFLIFCNIVAIILGLHGSKKTFPFEALLFHGLSYEEWRGAKEVKKKMDVIQKTSSKQESLSEQEYLIFLLILAFSGLIEYRPETPEERSDSDLGKFPKMGEVMTTYTVDPVQGEIIEKGERVIGEKEFEFLDEIKQDHIERIKADLYRGKTLSRLVYDGVRILFLRKKIGPKRPAKAESFANAFGIRIS